MTPVKALPAWLTPDRVRVCLANVLMASRHFGSDDVVCVYWRSGKGAVVPRKETLESPHTPSTMRPILSHPTRRGWCYVIIFDDVGKAGPILGMLDTLPPDAPRVDPPDIRRQRWHRYHFRRGSRR